MRKASALKNLPSDSLTTKDFGGAFSGSSVVASFGVTYCKLVKLDLSFLARESFCVCVFCTLFVFGLRWVDGELVPSLAFCLRCGDLLGEFVPSLNMEVGLSMSMLNAWEPIFGNMPSSSPCLPMLPLLILSTVKGWNCNELFCPFRLLI